jgi:type 1 glutamine amidotransferase
MSRLSQLILILCATFIAAPAFAADAAKKKVVFVAGRRSHGFGSHDHKAGCMLLAKRLNQSGLPIEAVVVENGWPADNGVFEGAAAIIVYADGGNGHPANPHLDYIQSLMDKGVGFGAIHYGVEVPKGKSGDKFLQWIGGYFETYWSVNPHWIADFKQIPSHAVTRGVKPFKTNDEWYYHMRFRDGMKGVMPILTAIPPDATRGKEGANDAHGGNPHVQARKGQPEHTLWVAEREGGGRGFGTTGGHWHWNWVQDDWRTLVLNSVCWIAKVEVPESGVPNKTPDVDEMLSNHDDAPNQVNKAEIDKKLELIRDQKFPEKK